MPSASRLQRLAAAARSRASGVVRQAAARSVSPAAAQLRVLPGDAPGAVRRLVSGAVLVAVIDAAVWPAAGRGEGAL